MKNFKSLVAKVSREEYGHLALLAMCDAIDDTKLFNKLVLAELLKDVASAARDKHARKVLLYLLAPRDKKYFHPDIVKKLQAGDSNIHR